MQSGCAGGAPRKFDKKNAEDRYIYRALIPRFREKIKSGCAWIERRRIACGKRSVAQLINIFPVVVIVAH